MSTLSPPRYRRSPVRSRSMSRSLSPVARRRSSPRERSPSPRSKRLRKAKEAAASRAPSASPPHARRRRSPSISPSPSPPASPPIQRASSHRHSHRHHHHHHHQQQYQQKGRGESPPLRNGSAEGKAMRQDMEEGDYRRRGESTPPRRGVSPSRRGGDREMEIPMRRGRERDFDQRSSSSALAMAAPAASHGGTSRAEVNKGFDRSESREVRTNSVASQHDFGDMEGDNRYSRGGDAREETAEGDAAGRAQDSLAMMEAATAALETAAKDKAKPSFELSGSLAAETNKFKGVTLLFTEPPEARKPAMRWRLYVFKEGEALKDPLYIHRQSCYLFGRERRVADIPTDHPSCSKQHAVIQYRLVEREDKDGILTHKVRPYIMDLGSTNGTHLNGERIEAQRYYELYEKDTIKFGNSSREYVLLHENSAG